MKKIKIINRFVRGILSVFLLLNAPGLLAQKIVNSGEFSAGFRFDTSAAAVEPIIQYQQNIDMLSGIDDRPSVRVFGNGRVLVHNPVYMKKAGDFEMQLNDAELLDLVGNLASNGIMSFDEKKVKKKISTNKAALRAKGELYEISDAVETVVDIKLDEYQENNKAAKVKNFTKQFRWKNIEQDAARYKDEQEINRANKSIQKLGGLMNDNRLVHRKVQ